MSKYVSSSSLLLLHTKKVTAKYTLGASMGKPHLTECHQTTANVTKPPPRQ